MWQRYGKITKHAKKSRIYLKTNLTKSRFLATKAIRLGRQYLGGQVD